MSFVGDIVEDATIEIPFTTNDSNGGAVAPSSAFEAADIDIYKDGGATQKTTTNGITMNSPFDSVTGLHLVSIDTSNDTGDASFWETGSNYIVVLNPDETVDGQTVVAVVGQFSIQNRHAPTDSPTKNAALSDIPVYMVDDSDHVTPETGLTLTEEVSKDGGAFAAAAGTSAEISNGLYQFDATAADMNADLVVFKFTATGADPFLVSFKTVT